MEYIDGMSLKAYVASQGGKIPYDQALTILCLLYTSSKGWSVYFHG